MYFALTESQNDALIAIVKYQSEDQFANAINIALDEHFDSCQRIPKLEMPKDMTYINTFVLEFTCKDIESNYKSSIRLQKTILYS